MKPLKFLQNVITSVTMASSIAETIFDSFCPVGSIYISIGDAKPSFGEWEKLATGRTLWNDNVADGRTIEAGLPNITGTFDKVSCSYYGSNNHSGAFQWQSRGHNVIGNNDAYYGGTISFDASWSNPIYGKSDTVQPPAIAVSMWRRIS